MARKKNSFHAVSRSIIHTENYIHNENPQNEAETVNTMESEAESSRPKRRGPKRCLEVQRLARDLVLPIQCNKYKQTVCINSIKFQRYLGTIARNCSLCPIGYRDWRNVPKTLKEKHFQLVEKKFYFRIFRKEMERLVRMSIGNKWREHKSRLREKYLDRSKSEAWNFNRKPPGIEPVEWQRFVANSLSEKGTTLHHTTGRTCYPRKRKLLEEERQQEVGPREFYKETHTRKSTGSLDPVASNILETIDKKVAEKVASSNGESVLFDLEREAFTETFGLERPGRVRGAGFGVMPSQMIASCRSPTVEKSEVIELKRKLDQMEEENEEKERRMRKIEEENEEKERRRREE